MSGAELCERQFQSTPPARGRLEKILLRLKKTAISIHAPREGGRLPSEYPGSGANDISIHAPARGGDAAYQLKIDALEISIHAPARGGDTSAADRSFTSRNFNPRPREGGRPWRFPALCEYAAISIHAPARGGDSKDAQFYLRIFDKQVELLRFWGKMRGGCLRNPEKDRRFLGKSLANLPEISGHLDFAGA